MVSNLENSLAMIKLNDGDKPEISVETFSKFYEAARLLLAFSRRISRIHN